MKKKLLLLLLAVIVIPLANAIPDDWCNWTTGIVAAWNLTNSPNNATDCSYPQINLSYVVAPPTYNESGVFFDGTNFITTGADRNELDFGDGNYTICFNFTLQNFASDSHIFAKDVGAGTGIRMIADFSGDIFRVGETWESFGDPQQGQDEAICIKRNSSTDKFYVYNYTGEILYEDTDSINPISNAESFSLGARPDGNGYLTGRIQYFVVFNRSLNDSELLYVWSTSSAPSPPNFDFSSLQPSNLTITNSTTVSFNVSLDLSANATDADCHLHFNDTRNQTITGYVNGTGILVEFNVTFDSNIENDLLWWINCTRPDTWQATTKNLLFLDDIPPTISSNLEGNTTQWTINHTFQFNTTDPHTYQINISDSCGFNYSNTSSPPSQLNYSNTTQKSQCSIGTHQTNLTICDGGTAPLHCSEFSYSWLLLSQLQIQAFDTSTTSAITNFAIYSNGTLVANVTNGLVNVNNLTLGDYNITINAPGYEIKNRTININQSFTQYNFSLYASESFLFRFFDEEDFSEILNFTKIPISLELISDIYSANYTINESPYFISLLMPSFYTMRYSSPGYFERFYYVNLTTQSHFNISLYLLNQSTGAEITGTVYDQNADLVEDAYISALRYDITTNSYYTTEIAKSNFEGIATFSLILDEEFYKFIIQYPWGVIASITSPSYVYETSLTFNINVGTSVLQSFFESNDVLYSLTFNNATRNAKFDYVDNGNTITQACLYLYQIGIQIEDQLVNSSCSTSTTGTILVSVPNGSGTVYRADTLINNDDYPLSSLTIENLETSPNGPLGTFLIILLSLVFLCIGYWSMTIALMLFPLPLELGIILNLVDYNIGIALAIHAICLIVAVWISKRQ